MKRRGLWFSAGAVVVLIAGALLLLAPSLPAPSPYRFLEGHQSLEQDLSEADRKQIASLHKGLTLRFYTWQGNYWLVRKAVETELLSKGYTPRLPIGLTLGGYINYSKGDLAVLGLQPPTSSSQNESEAHSVTLLGDTRFSRDFYLGPKRPHQDKGWVTVIVMSTQSPGLFERLRNWVGF